MLPVVTKRRHEEVVSKKDKEIKILKAQLNKSEKELNDCKSKLESEEKVNRSLEDDMKVLKDENLDCIEKIENLKAEVKILKSLDTKKHNKILKLVEDLKGKDYSLSTCQMMLSQEQKKNRKLFKTIQKLEKEKSTLRDMHIQTISELHSKKIKALEDRLRKTKSKRIKKKCRTKIEKIKEVNIILEIEQ